MAQNDFVIANANGATVRADINSALQSLASASSGATAPGTTYNNQFWFDTTADILKIRDEANANWVNVASLVGTSWVPYSNGALAGTMANQNAASLTSNLVAGSGVSFVASQTAITSGTPNFATMGNFVTLSGTATANTLGTVQAGFLGVIHYGVAVTVVHNATSRILPTGANINFVAGDVEFVVSLGSGNWRTVNVQLASGAALLGATAAATQAQQEAASDTSAFVTPGRQHFHPSSAKAWGRINQTNNTLTANYGVSSVTSPATGRTQVNFSTAFSSTTAYVVVCAYGKDNAGVATNAGVHGTDYIINTVSQAEIGMGNGTSGLLNAVLASFAAWGDL